MRVYLIISLLLFVQCLNFIETFGQISKDDNAILNNIFKQVTINEFIVYVDTVNNTDFAAHYRLKDIINKGVITDRKQEKTIILTKKEKKYLLLQLCEPTVWADSLFPNSKRIQSNEMWTYLSQENNKRREAINQAYLEKDTLKIKKLRYDYTFVFSLLRPIYIRNNTVCLTSYSAMCGVDCGRTEISFYKKENNEWTKWIIISAGDF